MKRTKIAAIDVGSTKICTIMADVNDAGELRMLGVGTAESHGLEKGTVVNARDAARSISQAVKKAEKMTGYRLKSAYVGISGEGMSSLNNRGFISIPHNNELVHAADRKRALDIARSVEVADDQRLLHVIPRSYTLDGQGHIKNPVGMHGFRLNVETHIVAAPAISVHNLTKCVTNLGISIDGLVLKSLASAEAVLTEDERQRGVVLADIGGDTTDVAVFKDGSIYHTSTLPVGGYNVTNDIALGLGIPFRVAEKMKAKYGNVMPPERDSDDVTVTEDGHDVSYRNLCEIIDARIEELLRLILAQMPQTNYAEAFPSGLVLTGGSCNLPGITELGREAIHLPVRIGTPVNIDNDNDNLRDPAYATGVGLLYWKMKNEGSHDWQSKTWGLHVSLPRFLGYLGSKYISPQ